jgi:hypothetical protein
MSSICSHLDSIELTELPDEIAGCEDCLPFGAWWVHLRSPNRHASAHARTLRHPIARSAEPGEDWSWCYVDEIALEMSTR